MAKTTGESPWERKRPEGARKTALTPESKAKARQRARKAGRPYPNLVDNMRAATEQRGSKKKGTRKKSVRKSVGKKKAGSRKVATRKVAAKKRTPKTRP